MQVIQESIIEKAKGIISRHKGKLAIAAGLAALGGAGLITAGGLGYIGYKIGEEESNRAKKNTNSAPKPVANSTPKPVASNTNNKL